ncbi:MAG: DUF456 domain-containing protein [bacterium]|nr:DUF456 domain-containing protein [bacterium]
MALEIILIVLAFIFVLVGIAGIILPFLPGIPLAWLGVLIFGFAGDFSVISLRMVLIFLFLSLVVSALDLIVPMIGAKKYKASKEGLAGAIFGSVAGFLIGGPIGIILGFCMGLIFGEMYVGRGSQEISGILRGTVIGFLLSGLIKLMLALTMLGYLIVAIFKI